MPFLFVAVLVVVTVAAAVVVVTSFVEFHCHYLLIYYVYSIHHSYLDLYLYLNLGLYFHLCFHLYQHFHHKHIHVFLNDYRKQMLVFYHSPNMFAFQFHYNVAIIVQHHPGFLDCSYLFPHYLYQ